MSFTNNTGSRIQEVVGFVQNPNGRGTIGIIWSALAVVLLNTWTLIHPNIQPVEASELRKWLHKLNLAVIAAAAPDTIAATAFSQWRCARRSFKQLSRDLPWWKMQHAFYAEMGGYKVADQATGQLYSFRSPQLIWLHRQKLITIPEVPLNCLKERSQGNTLGKIIACGQSAWFLISSIARLQQKLPITTLEVELIPMVLVTWLIYFWWWSKPMDLQTYTLIKANEITINDLQKLAKETCCLDSKPPWWRPVPKEMHPWGWDFYWMTKPVDMKKFSFQNSNHLIPPDLRKVVHKTMGEWNVGDWYRPAINEAHPNEWDPWDGWVIYLVGMWLYGFPLVAWNYRFPSEVESILWKAANLSSIVVCSIWLPIAIILRPIGTNRVAVWRQVHYYFAVLIVASGRLYLVIEVFLGLRLCPAGVYESVDWSVYTPYIIRPTLLYTGLGADLHSSDLSLSGDPLQSYCGIEVSNNFCGYSGQTVLESGGRTCAQVASLVALQNSQGAGTELLGEFCGEPLNVVYSNSGLNIGKAVVENGGDNCADGCVIAYDGDGDGSCSG